MRQYLDIINENNDTNAIRDKIAHMLMQKGEGIFSSVMIAQEIVKLSPEDMQTELNRRGFSDEEIQKVLSDESRYATPIRPNNQQPPTDEPQYDYSDEELDALFQSKDNSSDKPQMNEEINISGSAEDLIQLMKLAGAGGAEQVTPDTISQGPELEPCPICGKMHDPESGGCGASSEMDMGDYIRMVSSEQEEHDGDFDDATTEPDETYMNDVSASIPNGNDLNRKKGSHGPTNGGDNPMALEDEIRAKLAASLAEKMKTDTDVAEDDDPCWDGYEMIGMKKKNGKEVPNCVPKK